MKKRLYSIMVILFIAISILGETGITVSASETSTTQVSNVTSSTIDKGPTHENDTKGTLNNIVIFVAFKEETTTMSKESLINNATKVEELFNGNSMSLRTFISDVSEKQLTVNSYFPQQDESGQILYYEAPYTYEDASKKYSDAKIFLEALSSIKNKIPSNLDLDINKDGYVDNITFVSSHPLQSHASSFYPSNNQEVYGKRIGYHDVISSQGFDRVGYTVINHEFLHSLGFRDMYDTESWKNTGWIGETGSTTIMECINCYPTVYERIKYGKWISEPQVITQCGTYTISSRTKDPKTNIIAYKIPIENSESYFMVEYIDQYANINENNVAKSGLAIYAINPNHNGNMGLNNNEMYFLRDKSLRTCDDLSKIYPLDGTEGRNRQDLYLFDGTSNGIDLDYYIQNIVIKDGKLSFDLRKKTEVVIDEFNPTTTTAQAQIGDTVSFTTKASGGTGTITYSLQTRIGTNAFVQVASGTENTLSWKPTESGTYDVRLVATDANGNSKTETISYNVMGKLKVTGIVSRYVSPQRVGKLIDLRAEAINYKGSYTANFTIKKNNVVVKTLGLYYSDIDFWRPSEAGNYTITADVRDAEGNTATKTINYTIEDNISVSKLTADKVSPQKVGTTICLNTQAINFESNYGTKFTIKKDGAVVNTLGDYTTKLCYWTPSQVGIYTITAEVKDTAGNIATRTMDYTIVTDQITKNITTIYYKGYANPYIHYKIGSGAWTSVPGIKMVQSNEVAGYNYKAVIDLGTAANLTACFNNGGSQWDSNNGNNYVFNEGYYTFESGKIAKIEKPQNTLSIDTFTTTPTDKVTVGKAITLSATVSNNTGDVSYKFTRKNNDTGEIETLADFSKNTTTTCCANIVGSYTLTVEAKDSLTTVKKDINFVVEPVKNLSITSVTSSLGDKFKTNLETTLTVNADGESGDKTYTVSVNGQSILVGSTSNTVNWKPTKAGTYKITVQVNAISSIATYEKTITVEDVSSNITTIYYKGYTNPYIHYRVGSGAWTTAPGVKMTASTEVSGYDSKITIDLGTADSLTACFNNGSGSWDSNNGSNYTFKEGSYTCSNGVISPVNVTNTLSVSSLTTDKTSPQKVGTQITLSATALNYKTSYGTNFIVKKNGVSSIVYNDFNSSSALWTPTEAGTYTITAEVRDAVGNTATKTMDYTITSDQIAENNTTIYYKGYTNPYIHYKIGNGAWTTAPGIKMTSDLNGYYKITIDLGTADTLIACFNNGSGSWDSNNGANYIFKAGTYYYSNKVIQTTPF